MTSGWGLCCRPAEEDTHLESWELFVINVPKFQQIRSYSSTNYTVKTPWWYMIISRSLTDLVLSNLFWYSLKLVAFKECSKTFFCFCLSHDIYGLYLIMMVFTSGAVCESVCICDSCRSPCPSCCVLQPTGSCFNKLAVHSSFYFTVILWKYRAVWSPIFLF